MLSELQHFCLNAMGLSHGIAPSKKIFAHNKQTNNTKASALPTEKRINNTPKKIQPVIPKTDIAKPANKTKVSQPQSIAPKDCKQLDNWDNLQTAIKACQYCSELTQCHSQKLFGTGNPHADLMIISEAPNNDEHIQEQPFVGKAGTLLDNMLFAINIKRENTFITNIIKCQPPNNRDPHKDETQACATFLNAQIQHIKPKLILALGRTTAQNLLNVKTPIEQLRGNTYQYGKSQIPLIVSYHPAYLLRNPNKKSNAWDDLKKTHQILNQHD